MAEEFRQDFTKESWPTDAQYAHGTETKDGFILCGLHKTVHGYWYHICEKDTGNPLPVEDALHQDLVVPVDSPRILNQG